MKVFNFLKWCCTVHLHFHMVAASYFLISAVSIQLIDVR